MLPDHNFLVSGAEWPTEKNIKKFGPSFSIFLGNYIFSVLAHVESQDYVNFNMENVKFLQIM